MLTLLKPYGRLLGEAEDLAGIVRVEGLEPRGEPLDAKLARADLMLGDVDMRVTERVLDKAPKLRALVCRSIGTDFVDIKAASARNVLVVNSPEFCVKAVAEYAVGLMFDLARGITRAKCAVDGGDWEIREELRGIELEGRTLGLVGFGRIGREVARRAVGLGMRAVACDPAAAPGWDAGMGVEIMELDEVLRAADVLSIHSPLTDGTRGMIGPAQLSAMRDGALLINVSRGGIVDEPALLEALRSGKLRGAALDVLAREPLAQGHTLYQTGLPNLIITPHAAWNTGEAGARNRAMFVEQVRCIAAGTLPPGVVNREIAEQWRGAMNG